MAARMPPSRRRLSLQLWRTPAHRTTRFDLPLPGGANASTKGTMKAKQPPSTNRIRRLKTASLSGQHRQHPTHKPSTAPQAVFPLVAVYRMAATMPPYARPEIVQGQQCAEAQRERWSDTKQLPWLRCRRSRHQGAIADLTLVPAANAGPPRTGSACPAGRLCVWRCPKACRAVRLFPVHIASVSHGDPGGVDGCPAGYDGAGGVRKTVRS